MAKEDLDVPEVGPLLKEVGCKAVAQGVNACLFRDAGRLEGLVEDILESPDGHGTGFRAFEKPGLGMEEVPVLVDDGPECASQKGVAVLPPLPGTYPDDAAVEVEVLEAEFGDLADAKACGVGEGEHSPMFEVRGSAADAHGLLPREHPGQLSVGMGPAWRYCQ